MSRWQTSKQVPVSLPEICAPRTELIRAFEKAAERPVIFVHAPAGYGKTISTLLWLKKTERKAIWISLDPYDNTPLLFYKLFCMSLINVIPCDQSVPQSLKSPAFGAAPIECTMDVLTRLSYDEIKYALILDDFHVIQNEGIRKSIPYVLKRLPISFSIVILSRNGLSESETFFYGAENISHIGIGELSLSAGEIRKHFGSYGRFITREEASQIREYTEGWIIALNTMAMSGNIEICEETRKVSFHDFIEKNIWKGLDESLQTFLMKTAVPDKFSVELCEYLTGNQNCKEILDRLVSGNINISLIDAQYRYHNLFLEFLRDRLRKSNLDTASLNRRAAEYYLKAGDFMAAKNHAMKSGDIPVISQTIRSFYSVRTFSLDEYVEFSRLYNLNRIPDAICDKIPLLYIARIFFAYLVGDIDELRELVDKLYPVLSVISEKYPESLENSTSVLLMDCRVRLSEFDLHFVHIPKAGQSHSTLQSPTFTFQLPFLHRCARDFYEILNPKVMENVRKFSENVIKENLDIMFEGARSGLLMEKNELGEALELALNLKSTVNDKMSPEFVYALHVLIAELYLLQKQKSKCEAVLKEVKTYINSNGAQYLLKNLTAYEVRIALLDGNASAAENWLKNYYVDDRSFHEFYKIYRNFTTIRSYIVLNELDKAQNALSQIKLLAGSYDRLQDMAEAEVLLSVIDWVSNRKKEAGTRLLSNLELLYPYGFIRIVANEGRGVLPILSSLLKRMEREGHPSEGFVKYVKKVYMAACDQARRFKGLTHRRNPAPLKLSPRQKHVLHLLEKGYSNAEIVAETGLSLNTIRTHTKLAYKKLEVNNALDAILKAKELKLL